VIIFISVVSLETYFFRKLIRKIKILEGFLPICANCKKIRNQDQWEQIEKYISENSLARFSHSLCPECLEKLYPDLLEKR
jgi:predicted RNA-binding protein